MTQVLAHRGASRQCRENTVEAFRRAAELRADGVELDVRRRADGALVINHDPLPDGPLPAHVPSLAAALDACAGMWVNVEIKNDPHEADFDPDRQIAAVTVAELRARGEDHRWLISSFDLATIERCRALAPSIATAWLTYELRGDEIDTIVAGGHAAWHPFVGTLTAEHVAAAHRAGLAVNTWTCDDPARMAELVRWGIDGICTNVPDVARAVVDSAGPA